MREAVWLNGATAPEATQFFFICNLKYGAFFYDAFNNNNLFDSFMKMQHTVYMEMKHKVILDQLITQERIGNGKQGTPNYNKAILQAIEAIDTAREAHFQALLKRHRLLSWVCDEERTSAMITRLQERQPKLYEKIISGEIRSWEK